MIAGYHTAGLLLHDLCVAIEELAHLGYGCVAIRPHAGSLDPRLPAFGQQLIRLADVLSRTEVRLVIDLDAMFVHDPMVARGPSLVAADDAECDMARVWIERWADIAKELGADVITFSSGAKEASDFAGDEENLERLSRQLKRLLAAVQRDALPGKRVRLAIRPRCGDVIASVPHFERLGHWLGVEAADDLFLAADVGEMLAGGELPVSDRLARNLDLLSCLYLCDQRAGVAGDLRIGHGDVELKRVLQSLGRAGYTGPAIVRIEGHSDLGLAPAREAIEIFDDL